MSKQLSLIVPALFFLVVLSSFASAAAINYEHPTPTNGSVIIDNFFTINATADNPVTVLEVYVQSGSGSPSIYSTSSTHQEVALTNLADGVYTYYAQAAFSDGTNVTGEVRSVTVNTNFSIMLDTSIPSNGFTNASSTSIDATASHIPALFELYVFDSNGVPSIYTVSGTTMNSVILTNLAEGVYNYSAYAEIASGRNATTATQTFTVDRTTPVVTNISASITFPYDITSSGDTNFDVMGTVSENNTFAQVILRESGNFVQSLGISTVQNGSLSGSFVVPSSIANGNYDAVLLVSDRAGNAFEFSLGSLNVAVSDGSSGGSGGRSGGSRGSPILNYTSGTPLARNVSAPPSINISINTSQNATNATATSNSFVSRLTGAVVGAFDNPSRASILVIILIIAVIGVVLVFKEKPVPEKIETNTRKFKRRQKKDSTISPDVSD